MEHRYKKCGREHFDENSVRILAEAIRSLTVEDIPCTAYRLA